MRPVPRRLSALVSVGGIFVGALVIIATVNQGAPPAAFLPAGDNALTDPGDPAVVSAGFDAFLVQSGTERPYAGNGPPGIRLHVESRSGVTSWTLHGWANETTPPPTPTQVCDKNGVFFDAYDWTYESDGSANSNRGFFSTLPTTVPQRLAPSGDQCNARIYATGTWHVRVCIEGPPVGSNDVAGEPRGRYYNEADGRDHVDLWDTCIERLFQVP